MAIEDYWASTARNAKDVAQYAIYPLVKMMALMATKNSYQANLLAGVATSVFYTGLAETFLGREMQGFDHIARMAVAAEMGKKPEELKFSDYLDSKNVVVKKRMELLKKENWHRYPVGLLPLLPTVMEHVTRKVSPSTMRPENSSLAEGETRWRDQRPKPNAPAIEHLLHGWNLWDNVVYAGIAMLWLQETFNTDKTFIYQGRKELENNESLALKINANNMAALFNRMRDDAGVPMIDKFDREKIWPIYELLAQKVNENPNFGLPEITYLMGLGKLDIFAKDAKGKEVRDAKGQLIVDQRAWQAALNEIDHVERVGLAGIITEKKVSGKTVQHDKPSFVGRIGRGWLDAHYNGYTALVGKKGKYAESISPRDAGEVLPYSTP